METQGVMPTSVQPLILPDTDDSVDDIKSPEAPPCSPISFTDNVLSICETVPEGSANESDQEPHWKMRQNLSPTYAFFYCV